MFSADTMPVLAYQVLLLGCVNNKGKTGLQVLVLDRSPQVRDACGGNWGKGGGYVKYFSDRLCGLQTDATDIFSGSLRTTRHQSASLTSMPYTTMNTFSKVSSRTFDHMWSFRPSVVCLLLRSNTTIYTHTDCESQCEYRNTQQQNEYDC